MTGREYVARAVVIGYGGWSLYAGRSEHSGCTYASTTASGYGADWLAYVTGELQPGHHAGWDRVGADGRTAWEHDRDGWNVPDDCPVIDLTAVPRDEAAGLVCAGPMVGPNVPAGHVSTLSGPAVPWSPAPDPARDAAYSRLGTPARGLDQVAPDVYATIAGRYGARVTTAGEVRARVKGGCPAEYVTAPAARVRWLCMVEQAQLDGCRADARAHSSRCAWYALDETGQPVRRCDTGTRP